MWSKLTKINPANTESYPWYCWPSTHCLQLHVNDWNQTWTSSKLCENSNPKQLAVAMISRLLETSCWASWRTLQTFMLTSQAHRCRPSWWEDQKTVQAVQRHVSGYQLCWMALYLHLTWRYTCGDQFIEQRTLGPPDVATRSSYYRTSSNCQLWRTKEQLHCDGKAHFSGEQSYQLLGECWKMIVTKQVAASKGTALHEGPRDNRWPSVKTARDQAVGYWGEPWNHSGHKAGEQAMALHSMQDPQTTAGHQSKQLKTKLLGIQENPETTLVIKHTTACSHPGGFGHHTPMTIWHTTRDHAGSVTTGQFPVDEHTMVWLGGQRVMLRTSIYGRAGGRTVQHTVQHSHLI